MIFGSPLPNTGLLNFLTPGSNTDGDEDWVLVLEVEGVSDTRPPTVSITAPTPNPIYLTNASPLTLGGTAADDVAVSAVSWVNSAGGSGIASGTTIWTATGIVLQHGVNVLVVTARDAGGENAHNNPAGPDDGTPPPTPPSATPPAGHHH